MAKKSNKTEHVLRLITKNEESAQDDDFFVIDREVGGNESRPEVKVIVPSAAQVIVHSAVQTDQEEKPQDLKPEPEATAAPEDHKPEPEATTTPEDHQPEPEVPIAAAQPEPATVRAFRVQESTGSTAVEQHSDDIVNIAELLARDKVGLVMERMKVCTCRTCVNDVLALALNALPTKYVTADVSRQLLQCDSYKRQYETDLLAALTKACVRVKASPRH